MNDSKSSQFFHVLDHASYRVTSTTFTGVLVGLCYGTYKGLPLGATTISMTSSFALVSTACFVPERIFFMSSFRIKEKGNDECEKMRLLISHVLGGFVGGSVTGGLFKGKPLPGILLLTPIMTAVGFGEIRLEEYRLRRMKELGRS